MANFKGIPPTVENFIKITILIFLCVDIRTVLGLSGEIIGDLRKKLLTGYDKHAIPIVKDKPVEVTTEMNFFDMVPRQKADMHFSIDVLLHLQWHDNRLKYNFTGHDHGFITFDYSFLNEIWSPSLYFVESKAGNLHTHPQPNILVNIYPSGKVLYVQRLAVHSFCLMKMQFYPFDIQRCNLTIQPFSYNKEFIELKWAKQLKEPKEIYHHEFNQVLVKYGSSDVAYSVLGNFSRVFIQFTLHRHLAVYILRDFFPCMIIVCLSWTSFWINFRSTPARVALGITTILTMFAVTNSIRDHAPQVGSFRSIDVYMLTCNLLTIFALIEYVLVGMTSPKFPKSMKYKEQKEKKRTKDFQKCSVNKGFKLEENRSNNQTTNGHTTTKTNKDIDEEKKIETYIQCEDDREVTKFCRLLFYNDQTHVIDRIARVFFPVTFVLFNAGYFIFHRLSPKTVN